MPNFFTYFQLITIFSLLCNYSAIAADRQADENTSKSLSINAAQYDSPPSPPPLLTDKALEFHLPFYFFPKRKDDVMGRGAQKSPRVIFTPQIGWQSRWRLGENFSIGPRVWAGYLNFDKLPVGKLKKMRVVHGQVGLSAQAQYQISNWLFYLPVVYQHTFGLVEGHFIHDELNTRSRFNANQYGTGFGVYNERLKTWFSLLAYKREAESRFRFHDTGEEYVARDLSEFKHSFQYNIGYRYSKSFEIYYSHLYIVRRLLIPKVGLTWHFFQD